MQDVIVSILSGTYVTVVVILLFSLTIFVHELGHFLTALHFGMVIDVFSIGFGPAIWKKKIKGITYKICWIPVGGYVALPQLDPTGMETVQGGKNGEEKPKEVERELPPIAPWKKAIVALAGSIGNIIFATFLAWIIFLCPDTRPSEINTMIGYVIEESTASDKGLKRGDWITALNNEEVSSWNGIAINCMLLAGPSEEVTLTVQSGDEEKTITLPTMTNSLGHQMIDGLVPSAMCVVTNVFPGSSAEEAGIQNNDIIRRFDGIRVGSVGHLIDLVTERADKTVPITVRRQGEDIALKVTPRVHPEHGRPVIGVGLTDANHGIPQWMEYRNPWKQIKSDFKWIVRTFRAFFSDNPGEAKAAANGISGPIIILVLLWSSVKTSLLYSVGFIRFLNINLALINLLPIPVLDGGHVVFAAYEGITRKKPHPKVVNALVNVFAVLLIGMVVLIVFKDSKLVKKLFFTKPAVIEEMVVEPEGPASGQDSSTNQQSVAE